MTSNDVPRTDWRAEQRDRESDGLAYTLFLLPHCEVEPFSVPGENALTLEAYVAHAEWPNNEELANVTSEPVLVPLATWITATVRFAVLLRAGGGAPPELSRREPEGLLSGVVRVSDALASVVGAPSAIPGADAEDDGGSFGVVAAAGSGSAHKKKKGDSGGSGTPGGGARGWRAAYAGLLAPCLEDMRVFRAATRLVPGGAIYTINVYHDRGRVFFMAYDPDSSGSLLTTIRENDINALLAPNSVERAEFGARAPPQSADEMYSRLVKLLTLDQIASTGSGKDAALNKAPSARRKDEAAAAAAGGNDRADARAFKRTRGAKDAQHGAKASRLVCRRKLTKLLKETRKVSGHLATVTVYEEARGELRCHAYLPQVIRLMIGFPHCSYSFIRSFVHSFIRSFVHSFIR